MGNIVDAINTVWRDYVTENVPASGAHEPEKPNIRAIGPLIESAIADAALGALVSVVKDTRDNLNADLAHAADTVALVYGDALDTNNDLYVKVGASGSGSWTNTGALRKTALALAAPSIESVAADLDGVPWLHFDALRLTGLAAGLSWTDTTRTLARAIKSVTVEGAGVGASDQFYIGTFCNDDAAFQENVVICRVADNVVVAELGLSSVTKNPSGPTELFFYKTSPDVSVRMLVDYREISATGILLNSATITPLILSRANGPVERDRRDQVSQAREALWLDPDALGLAGACAAFKWTPESRLVARAIKDIRLTAGFSSTVRYRITGFSWAAATSALTVTVRDETAGVSTISGAVVCVADGPLMRCDVVDSGGYSASIWIDPNVLAANVTYPTLSSSPLLISRANLLSTRTARKGMGPRFRNVAIDPILANGTATWTHGGSAPVVGTANAELVARGVSKAIPFGTGATVTFLYKRDAVPPRNNGKYVFSSALVYSASGSNWPGNSYDALPYTSANAPISGRRLIARGYEPLTANLRRYWCAVQLPAAGAIAQVFHGFGGIVSGSAAEISGFTLTISDSEMSPENVAGDDWAGYTTRDEWRESVDSSLAANAANIATARAPLWFHNRAQNPNLAADGETPVFLAPATVTLVAPTSPALRARGVDRTVKAGNDTPSGFYVYKDEPVTAGDVNKYAFVSFYIWSQNGTNWPGDLPVYFYGSGGAISNTGPIPFVQIDANTRRYYWAGQIPNNATVNTVRYGPGSRVSTTGVEFGGFTFVLTDLVPLTADNTPVDEWYPDGSTPRIIAGAISRIDAQTATASAAARAVRVAFMGSSITWGAGYLGEDSYIGYAERRLREQFATTVLGSQMETTGDVLQVSGKNWYRGSVTKLSGIGASAACSFTGDEFSVAIGRERGNAGAALVQLYVDGVLHDTFSTANTEPFQTGINVGFTGDGTTKSFDLGRAFTYAHAVTVAGAAKTGSLYSGGYGGAMPVGDDYMVLKQLVMVSGVPEIHHFLQFAVAPANGAAVSCTFSAGESVSYMQSPYGNVAVGFNSALESAYGNGNVAYDPANPTPVSSGLAFRSTDERALKTWRFTESKTRTFELRVASLDPVGTGTPCLWLNFATNRMHWVMNAGIGGWHTEAFVNDTGFNNVSRVIDWRPDVVFLESGTNEDNAYPAEKKAYVTRTAVSAAAIIAEDTANWFRTITNTGGSDHTVQDIRIPITAVSRNSVTLDGTNATFNIEAGDVIVLGDYKNDNRRLAARTVTGWNAGTRVVSFLEPLTAEDFAHVTAISELVGQYAFVIEPDRWGAALGTIVSALRGAVPTVQIALGSSGLPNQFDRSLEGYREFLAARAAALEVDFVDFYAVTGRWTYSLPPSVPFYLTNSGGTTSTGAGAYPLYAQNGTPPSDMSIRPWSVKINGFERINRGCYVTGGRSKSWPAGTTVLSKAANGTGNWEFVQKPYTLVFTSSVPASGATILVNGQTADWSADDTHPANPTGLQLFAQAAFGPLDETVQRALGKPHAQKWG